MVTERRIVKIAFDQEGHVSDLGGAKKELTTSWAILSSYLPEELNPDYKKFVRDYFRAQVRIKAGQKKELEKF